MSEWTDVELGDVLTLQRGFDLPTRSRKPGPYPIVSSSGVTGFHSEFKVGPPGVVIGRTGTLGSVHWITDPYWPLNTSLWVKEFKGNDRRFVSYLLQNVTIDSSTTSAVPGVNRNHLHKLHVCVPEVHSQRRIAAMLSAFDDLIEINERWIELLEGLARSLYREWFVHFRFPGHEEVGLVDSELGPVPEGWVVRRIDDLATLHRRSTKPTDEPETIFEHFSIPAFDTAALPLSESGRAIKSSKYRVEVESVLLSKINPRIARVWFAQPRTAEAIASTEFLIWVGADVSNAWLWSLFLDGTFRGRLVGSAGGTSTSHQRFKPDDVARATVAVAPTPLLDAFDSLADPALRHAASIREQNRQLAATRDLLLPRLVTGRLDISEIDLGILTPTESE